MRKTKKKQLLSILSVFAEAVVQIKTYLMEKNYDAAINLLVDCQDNGYSLIEFIGESEGDEHITIKEIESFCKLIFDVHGEITSGSQFNTDKIISRLRKSIEDMELSFNRHIEVLVEVAFLPYKASMWDSLESVWLAADSDKNCNAVVMPIPYFDRNNDYSLGESHYEGDDFPDYVPVVHYNQYDIKEIQPDIIYIHNPYDDSNLVTTIYPEFYAKNLKQFCDLLVYIPYFSTSAGLVTKDTFYDSFNYIDYIINQSKYIESFYSDIIPKNKFLTLGSPKFDRLLGTSKSNSEVPEEWINQAQNKKVYFFNTSIGGALENTANFLNKLKYVFETFEQNKSNSCLLWRPHPLLETAFKSMLPNYYDIYNKLKEYFIKTKLGIYDDSPSMGEAIAFSDVFIGDSKTSITSLFSASGKPLFILNNAIHSLPEENDWEKAFTTFYGDSRVVNGKHLFSPTGDGYSYKHVFSISKDEIYIKRACTVGGKTYLTHKLGEHLLVLEDNKITKKIELNFSSKGAHTSPLKNYLIVTIVGTTEIAIINTDNDEVHYIPEYKDFYTTSHMNVIKVGGHCLWNNHIVLSSPIINQLLFIDTKDFTCKVSKVAGLNQIGFNSLVSSDSYIWCMPYEGAVIHRYNPINHDVKAYSALPDAFKFDGDMNEQAFYGGVLTKNKLILTPYNTNNFISIDLSNDSIDVWDVPFEIEEPVSDVYRIADARKFVFEDQCSETIFRLKDIQKRKYYEIGIESKQFTEHRITMDRDEISMCEPGFKKYYEFFLYCCVENVFNTLDGLLNDNIIGDSFNKEEQLIEFKKISENTDGTAGKEIHKSIMEKLRVKEE